MRRLSFLPSARMTRQVPVTRLYDSAARGWQAGIDRIGYGEACCILCRRALAHVPVHARARVLDAGTGTGALSATFHTAAPGTCEFDLLDLSRDMFK